MSGSTCSVRLFWVTLILTILLLHECSSYPLTTPILRLESESSVTWIGPGNGMGMMTPPPQNNLIMRNSDRAQDRLFLPPTFPYWGPFGLTGSAILCPLLVGPTGGSWNRACAGPVPPFKTTTPIPPQPSTMMTQPYGPYQPHQQPPLYPPPPPYPDNNYNNNYYPDYQGEGSSHNYRVVSDDDYFDLPSSPSDVTISSPSPRRLRRPRNNFLYKNHREPRSSRFVDHKKRPRGQQNDVDQEVEPSTPTSSSTPWAGFMFSFGPFYVEGDMGVWG